MKPIKSARVAGFPTRVLRVGKGVRRALFIHCTMGHAGSWLGVQAALLGKLSMTAFDRPGHGESADWDGTGGSAGLHDLTTRIAGALIDNRADVIGHSFGATVALRLALERPDQVRSLVLIEPPMIAALRGTPAYDAKAEMMARVDAALAADNRLEAARLFHAAMSPEVDWAGLPAEVRDRMAARIHLVAAEAGVTMRDTPGLLAEGRLEKIKQPVLMIEGSASPPALRAIHEALAARLPQAQRVVVVGAGHMSPLTHPANVAGEIAAFLKV